MPHPIFFVALTLQLTLGARLYVPPNAACATSISEFRLFGHDIASDSSAGSTFCSHVEIPAGGSNILDFSFPLEPAVETGSEVFITIFNSDAEQKISENNDKLTPVMPFSSYNLGGAEVSVTVTNGEVSNVQLTKQCDVCGSAPFINFDDPSIADPNCTIATVSIATDPKTHKITGFTITDPGSCYFDYSDKVFDLNFLEVSAVTNGAASVASPPSTDADATHADKCISGLDCMVHYAQYAFDVNDFLQGRTCPSGNHSTGIQLTNTAPYPQKMAVFFQLASAMKADYQKDGVNYYPTLLEPGDKQTIYKVFGSTEYVGMRRDSSGGNSTSDLEKNVRQFKMTVKASGSSPQMTCGYSTDSTAALNCNEPEGELLLVNLYDTTMIEGYVGNGYFADVPGPTRGVTSVAVTDGGHSFPPSFVAANCCEIITRDTERGYIYNVEVVYGGKFTTEATTGDADTNTNFPTISSNTFNSNLKAVISGDKISSVTIENGGQSASGLHEILSVSSRGVVSGLRVTAVKRVGGGSLPVFIPTANFGVTATGTLSYSSDVVIGATVSSGGTGYTVQDAITFNSRNTGASCISESTCPAFVGHGIKSVNFTTAAAANSQTLPSTSSPCGVNYTNAVVDVACTDCSFNTNFIRKPQVSITVDGNGGITGLALTDSGAMSHSQWMNQPLTNGRNFRFNLDPDGNGVGCNSDLFSFQTAHATFHEWDVDVNGMDSERGKIYIEVTPSMVEPPILVAHMTEYVKDATCEFTFSANDAATNTCSPNNYTISGVVITDPGTDYYAADNVTASINSAVAGCSAITTPTFSRAVLQGGENAVVDVSQVLGKLSVGVDDDGSDYSLAPRVNLWSTNRIVKIEPSSTPMQQQFEEEPTVSVTKAGCTDTVLTLSWDSTSKLVTGVTVVKSLPNCEDVTSGDLKFTPKKTIKEIILSGDIALCGTLNATHNGDPVYFSTIYEAEGTPLAGTLQANSSGAYGISLSSTGEGWDNDPTMFVFDGDTPHKLNSYFDAVMYDASLNSSGYTDSAGWVVYVETMWHDLDVSVTEAGGKITDVEITTQNQLIGDVTTVEVTDGSNTFARVVGFNDRGAPSLLEIESSYPTMSNLECPFSSTSWDFSPMWITGTPGHHNDFSRIVFSGCDIGSKLPMSVSANQLFYADTNKHSNSVSANMDLQVVDSDGVHFFFDNGMFCAQGDEFQLAKSSETDVPGLNGAPLVELDFGVDPNSFPAENYIWDLTTLGANNPLNMMIIGFDVEFEVTDYYGEALSEGVAKSVSATSGETKYFRLQKSDWDVLSFAVNMTNPEDYTVVIRGGLASSRSDTHHEIEGQLDDRPECVDADTLPMTLLNTHWESDFIRTPLSQHGSSSNVEKREVTYSEDFPELDIEVTVSATGCNAGGAISYELTALKYSVPASECRYSGDCRVKSGSSHPVDSSRVGLSANNDASRFGICAYSPYNGNTDARDVVANSRSFDLPVGICVECTESCDCNPGQYCVKPSHAYCGGSGNVHVCDEDLFAKVGTCQNKDTSIFDKPCHEIASMDNSTFAGANADAEHPGDGRCGEYVYYTEQDGLDDISNKRRLGRPKAALWEGMCVNSRCLECSYEGSVSECSGTQICVDGRLKRASGNSVMGKLTDDREEQLLTANAAVRDEVDANKNVNAALVFFLISLLITSILSVFFLWKASSSKANVNPV